MDHTYINTTLITLLHSYMFHPSRGHPQGELIHFVSRVIKMSVRCKYQINEKRADSCYVTYSTLLLNLILKSGHTFCRPC